MKKMFYEMFWEYFVYFLLVVSLIVIHWSIDVSMVLSVRSVDKGIGVTKNTSAIYENT